MAEDFRKYLDPKVLQKITRLDLKARLIVEHEDVSTPAGKAKALHAIIESVLKIKDEIKQIPTIHDIADRLGLDDFFSDRDLLREFEHVKRQVQKSSYDRKNTDLSTGPMPGSAAAVLHPQKTRATQSEFALTELLIRNAAIRPFVFSNMKLERIKHPVLQQIMKKIHAVYSAEEELDAGKLMGQFENPKVTAFIANALTEQNNEKATVLRTCTRCGSGPHLDVGRGRQGAGTGTKQHEGRGSQRSPHSEPQLGPGASHLGPGTVH